MNRKQLVIIAGLGSAGMLLGAFAFQHLGGLAPCKMCIWQRYPHVIAAIIAFIAVTIPLRILTLFGFLAAATTSYVGFYHAGVEKGWFEGPDTCTSGPIANLTPQQLMDQIMAAPLIRCDEIAWSLMGVSMAGWNGIISLLLALVWLMAYKRS
ncbi:MAG: disulfide bond formation protein B [Paracoccaceae bacterium]|jgi:disulfide bond formation protein DsbB|nr:disulfide bond formation protein, DsbB family [Rhodobacteraceae bacterium HTCC2150]MDG1531650.1 disulfide bond formation protein B [Paracoccaceae bacterium]